ncbi:hypothetical protein Tco_0549344 [Tanacetum coccineum]
MANKHSIMTREMVESFCDSYYIPDEVHPIAPGRDRTITQFPEGKVGVYTRLFDYCGYRIPLTKFFVAVLKHFRIHVSQLSPFGAASYIHFELGFERTWVCLTISGLLTPGRCKRWRSKKGKSRWFWSVQEASAQSAGEKMLCAEVDVIPGVGKTLASLRRTIPEGSLLLGSSSPADVHTQVTVRSSRVTDAPVYTVADTVTSSREIELELKEKLRVKYDTQGVLLKEKDVEIARLKSLVKEKESGRGETWDCIFVASEVSTLHYRLFVEFLREDWKVSMMRRLRSCYKSCGIRLEAHVVDVTARVPRNFGSALGRAVDYDMQEGLAVTGHEHGVAGNPFLASKKDFGMDEVLDCFLLDGPLADLPEAAHLQSCLEQLSVPIYHADVNAVAGKTSLSFALLNIHTPSTSAVAFCVEDLDTDEDLGSVVCMPHLEDPRFEFLP